MRWRRERQKEKKKKKRSSEEALGTKCRMERGKGKYRIINHCSECIPMFCKINIFLNYLSL